MTGRSSSLFVSIIAMCYVISDGAIPVVSLLPAFHIPLTCFSPVGFYHPRFLIYYVRVLASFGFPYNDIHSLSLAVFL